MRSNRKGQKYRPVVAYKDKGWIYIICHLSDYFLYFLISKSIDCRVGSNPYS